MAPAAKARNRYGLTHDPVIVHCPWPLRVRGGMFEQEWANACRTALSDEQLRGLARELDGITIVTYSNYGEKTLLERDLEFLGLENFVVLRTDARPWTQRYKLTLVLDWIAGGNCPTELLLCLDADDNLIVDDAGLIAERFRATECDILFGATPANAPPSTECWSFECSVAEYTDPQHAHLNAGSFLGRADFIENCAREILDSARLDPSFCEAPKGFSDQLGWRRMHRKYYPRIKIDHACRVFLRFDHLR
ncbi:MAG: glycosyltransferase domain-containing protein [Bryobacteraceae bacterium]